MDFSSAAGALPASSEINAWWIHEPHTGRIHGAEHKARWLMPGFFPTIASNITVTVRRYTTLSRTHPDRCPPGEDSS